MYYEIHGTGRPLVLLHGAFMSATIYPALAESCQVIAVDLQGHGRTADIDRPLTFEQMADVGLDHIVEMHKLIPKSQLAVFPNTVIKSSCVSYWGGEAIDPSTLVIDNRRLCGELCGLSWENRHGPAKRSEGRSFASNRYWQLVF